MTADDARVRALEEIARRSRVMAGDLPDDLVPAELSDLEGPGPGAIAAGNPPRRSSGR